VSEARQAPGPTDRLRALGLDTLGKDPSPDAVLAFLQSWTDQLDGADELRRRLERDEIIRRTQIPANTVDAALRSQQRSRRNGGSSGQALTLSDPEEWPEHVVGTELLVEISETLARFLALPDGASEAAALWIVHAHAHDASEVSPILAVTSPVKRCGKTTLVELLSALVPRPLAAANVTPAATFRAVDRFHPTLLVDEADSFLSRNDELRGVLNSGHRRGLATVVRTVGDEYEARAFSTWAPKTVALIGRLPGTLADRSIEVRMRRQTRGERRERLRLDRLSELEPLRRRAWTWARNNIDPLRAADPEVPEELHDRAADNWRPLIAIADLAGGAWPERARRAALAVSGGGDAEASRAVLLLSDLRDQFEEQAKEQLPTSAILKSLKAMEDRPWPEWNRGAPLSAVSLARLLKPFGIAPRDIWLGELSKSCKGYRRSDLEDAWSRYLRSPASCTQSREARDHRSEAGKAGLATCETAGALAAPTAGQNPHGSGTLAGLAAQDNPIGLEGLDGAAYLADERAGLLEQ